MSTETEQTSTVFTEEAETALRRIVSRYERRVRGRALEEAVRARGVPAEVTGSDVQRASLHVVRPTYVPSYAQRRRQERFDFEDLPLGMARIRMAERVNAVARRTTVLERAARLYVWIGAVGTVIGLVWAPAYHKVRILSADPAWRVGFIIAQASFAMLVIGVTVKIYSSWIQSRRRRFATEGK